MALLTIDEVNIEALALPTKGFGCLYNGYAVLLNNIMPTNWKVPTNNELQTLINNIGAASAIKSIRTYPTYQSGWSGSVGFDNSTFSLLPAGAKFVDAAFRNKNTMSYTYSSTSNSSGHYYLYVGATAITMTYGDSHFGASLRGLMVDSSAWEEGDTVTDYDGNVYNTVKVGNQVWMASNFKCTHLNNGDAIALNSGNTYDWSYTSTPQYCIYNNAALIEE